MTRYDVEELAPGDSIIGLANRWNDEYPVVAVGAVRYAGERAVRSVSVRAGNIVTEQHLSSGGSEIRGVQGRRWSRY